MTKLNQEFTKSIVRRHLILGIYVMQEFGGEGGGHLLEAIMA